MKYSKSIEAFKQAVTVIPGGVNSPVRSCKSVGGNPVFIQSLYAEIEEMRKIIEFYGDKKLWIEEEVHATGFEFASRYDEEQGCSVPVHLEQGQLLGTRFKPRARVIADHGTKAQEYLEGK